MKNRLTVVLAIVALFFASGSAYLGQLLSKQYDVTDRETAARESAESELKELKARYSKLAQDFAAGASLSSSSPTAAVAAAELSNSKKASLRTNYSSGFYGSAPEGVEMSAGRQRPPGPFRMLYTQIAKSLKLSEADAAKLQKILDEDQQKMRRAADPNGGPAELKSFQEAMEAIHEETNKQLKELLGDEKYQEYEAYQRDLVEHQSVNRLNARLENSGIGGLSEDQQQTLFNALKEERNRVAPPTRSQYATGEEFGSAFQQWRQSYETRSEQRAATILNADQLNAFRTMRPPQRGRPPRGT